MYLSYLDYLIYPYPLKELFIIDKIFYKLLSEDENEEKGFLFINGNEILIFLAKIEEINNKVKLATNPRRIYQHNSISETGAGPPGSRRKIK